VNLRYWQIRKTAPSFSHFVVVVFCHLIDISGIQYIRGGTRRSLLYIYEEESLLHTSGGHVFDN
jgi:hypothetical protein